MWIARLVMLVMITMSCNGLAASLRASDEVATAGFITLNVENTAVKSPQHIQVQHLDSDFSLTLNLAPQQRAVTISGLSDGNYRATLMATENNTIIANTTFKVEHHAVNLALSLFALGLFLFLMLVAFISYGHVKNNNTEQEGAL